VKKNLLATMEMNRFTRRLVVPLLAVTVNVMGQDARSLRGLRGLQVVVEALSTDVEQAGLHKTDIQTDVELKLRLAGIKVLTDEENLKQLGFPILHLNPNVALTKTSPGLAYYSLDCELHQYVKLTRDESITTEAATWEDGNMGATTNLQHIRDSIKDLVDKFINDYLSVNPKK
jgi:hypothetical protein